jgi:hypothetical protein
MSTLNGPSDKAIAEAVAIMADLLNEEHPDLHFAPLKPGERLPPAAGLLLLKPAVRAPK